VSEKPPRIFAGLTVGAVRRCLLLLLLGLVAACQTAPPVQEMSDARMAIAVAKEAGAELQATDELKAAEDYLDRAEKSLAEKAYSQARRDALNAKRSALDALTIAETPDTDE
jgi:hypothetical protein